MSNNFSCLGIILARGGSKGLPGKNVKPLCGKPLINWSIDQGLQCSFVNDLIVSTDCQDIASVAIKAGAEVPFLRPKALALDTSSSIDAIIHAIDYLDDFGRTYDYVLLLEPTSPLRQVKDLEESFNLITKQEFESLVSVSEATTHHPNFMFTINDNHCIVPYSNGQSCNGLRRQDLQPCYFLDGSIYLSSIKSLKHNGGFYHSSTYAYVLSKWKSLEIDDLDDFLMVEALMKHKLHPRDNGLC